MLVGTGVQQAVTFLLIMILSRLLSKEEYATYSQGILIYRTLLPILQFGIPLAISYFLPQANNIYQEKSIFLNSLKIIFIGASLALLLIIFFRDFLSIFYNNSDFSDIVFPLGIYIFLEIINAIMPNFYISIGKNRRFALITIFISLIRAITVCLFAALNNSVKGIFIVLATVSGIKCMIFFIDVYRRYRKQVIDYNSSYSFTVIFKYGMVIGLSQAIGQVSTLLDQNVVASMFTPSEYAIFVNGAVDIPFIALIGSSIASVLLPEFAKKGMNNQEMLDKWKTGIIYTASFLLPIMTVLFVVAPSYITVVYSQEYIDSVPVFRIYLLKIPTMIATYSTILLAKKANSKILLNTVLSLIVNVILNITFIKFFGIYGAALGSILSLYILSILQIIQISKILEIQWGEVLPFFKILKIVLVCIIFGSIMAFLKAVAFKNAIIQDICGAVIFVIVIWGVLIKLKIVNFHYLSQIIIKR